MDWIQWVCPLAYLVGGLLAGVVFKNIVLARIKKWVGRTSWEGDDIIVEAVRKFLIPIWRCFIFQRR